MVWQLHEDKSQSCIKLCYMRSNCLMHNCSRLMIYIICPCIKARTKLGILRKTTSFNVNKQTIVCQLSHNWPINFLNKSIPSLCNITGYLKINLCLFERNTFMCQLSLKQKFIMNDLIPTMLGGR